MKKYKYLLILMLVTLFFSCTDIIELDLKNTEPRVVIEAVLNATDSTCTVNVSMSNEFYDTTEVEMLDDYSVVLIKNQTETFYLEKKSNKSYVLNNIIADFGDVFLITITDKEGKKYTAQAVTPGKVKNTIVIFKQIDRPNNNTEIDENGIERKILFGFCYWQDSLETQDYYRVKMYKDSVYLADNYRLISDEGMASDSILIGLRELFLEGDYVSVYVENINKESYTFFTQVADIQRAGMNSSTPYNPQGNFDNDAIGYFEIKNYTKFSIVAFDFPFPFP
jgi:hypothetical protein